MALGPMTLKVEFRDNNLTIFEVNHLDERESRVTVETCLYVLVPLTADIIRDKETGNPSLQRWYHR